MLPAVRRVHTPYTISALRDCDTGRNFKMLVPMHGSMHGSTLENDSRMDSSFYEKSSKILLEAYLLRYGSM